MTSSGPVSRSGVIRYSCVPAMSIIFFGAVLMLYIILEHLAVNSFMIYFSFLVPAVKLW